MKFVDTFAIRSLFDVPVRTSDGIRLSADIYRPPEPGDYPVLITRTPYDNNRAARPTGGTTLLPAPADRFKKLAAHGFIVVACDVRGRGDAGGAFIPFRHEAADGADVVAWGRELPECNGRVGLFGAGYAGFAALTTAAQPGVDAVVVWSPMGAGDGLPDRGGAIRLDWLFWMHLVGGRAPQPVDVPDWPAIFRHRPLADMHRRLGRMDVPWPEWLEHASGEDDYWAALDVGGALAATAAPILFVTGWWDAGLTTTLRHWQAARTSPGAAGHRLVVGPWDTAAVRKPSPDSGGIAWGPTALIDPDEMLLQWCDRRLRAGGRAEAESPVRAFHTGANEWRDLDGWPSAAGTRSLWLSSAGRANTRRGDGRLDLRTPPDAQPPDRFIHNPQDPVPWQPGYRTFSRSSQPPLTLDTSFATSRDDTLVYTADPVAVPLIIRGRPQVVLWAETDAADTDWVVSLEDVFPGGNRSVHLAHGIVRARTNPDFAPNRPVRYLIPLSEVAHELLSGHAVRLNVGASLFPLYAVNHGNADYLRGIETRRARQTIHHGRQFPSLLELPAAR